MVVLSTRKKPHHLVDLLLLIFFFIWYKQEAVMGSFLTDIGSCILPVFAVGLDWSFTLHQFKITIFLFQVLPSIQPF